MSPLLSVVLVLNNPFNSKTSSAKSSEMQSRYNIRHEVPSCDGRSGCIKNLKRVDVLMTSKVVKADLGSLVPGLRQPVSILSQSASGFTLLIGQEADNGSLRLYSAGTKSSTNMVRRENWSCELSRIVRTRFLKVVGYMMMAMRNSRYIRNSVAIEHV